MVKSPAVLGTKNDCAGEDQHQFTGSDQTRPENRNRSKALAAYDNDVDVMIKLTSFLFKVYCWCGELSGRY
jgi:hypothetical protein